MTQNYFELFNLPERFQLDLEILQENYRAIQKEIHPDRFATSSENEKVQSMIKSTQANDAYQTLKSPIKRAKYILSLHKSIEKITLPPDFLMQQMEWEEYLESISKQKVELEKFSHLINSKYQKNIIALEKVCDKDNNWNGAMEILNELQFVEKLNYKIIQQINLIDTK